jgi:tetratricopeptide (TPR) repeat protein
MAGLFQGRRIANPYRLVTNCSDMASISPEFVERYQLEYEKNPSSRIFAPLAEAYRQMGLIDEALRICSKGVQIHPDFAGGRVALAKIHITRDEKALALTQLEKAIQISPDNLLAQSLLGETLIDLRRPKDALKAYKMVLFLNPADEKAQRAVRKWEFLSADEYDDELFKVQPTFQKTPHEETAEPLEPLKNSSENTAAPAEKRDPNAPTWRNREIDRAISLADAFTIRGNIDRALEVLRDAQSRIGAEPEIDRRLTLLSRRAQQGAPDSSPQTARHAKTTAVDTLTAEKIEILNRFLRRINERRLDDEVNDEMNDS